MSVISDISPAHSCSTAAIMTIGKTKAELTALASAALREQAGCETADIADVHAVPNAGGGRNWEIPNVLLGDSLISDIDRAIMSVHRQLGRKYHLLGDI